MYGTNQLIHLAQYNQLMNQRQYSAAANLSTDSLCEDNGGVFKSVIGTFNYILVGDIVWLKRFTVHDSCSNALAYIGELDTPKSQEEILFSDLGELGAVRGKVDETIVGWVEQLSVNDLKECITYTNMAGISYTKPLLSLINHLFLHQVLHRGQITTLLSEKGIDFSETDLIEFVKECGV